MIIEPCNSINIKPFDIESQVWRKLNMYMDLRYLRKELKKNYTNQIISAERIDEKASEIQFCIKQAQEYFNSAKYSSIITKPVLIYYGFVSLCTALVIFKNKDKVLSSMPASHGLTMAYPDKISEHTRKQFLKISVNTNTKGLFSELANMDLSETYSKVYLSKDIEANESFRQIFKFNEVNSNFSTTDLTSILSNIPEIWQENLSLLEIPNNTFAAQLVDYKNSETIINTIKISNMNGNCKMDEILNKFKMSEYLESYNSTKDNYFLKFIENTMDMLPIMKTDRYGDNYIVSDINNPLKANNLIILYLTFFVLGSLARYKPKIWRVILEDNIQGFGKIPDILCEQSLTEVPILILKEFTNEHIQIKL